MSEKITACIGNFFNWFGNLLTKYIFNPIVEAIEKLREEI